MPIYRYETINRLDKKINGEISAHSAAEVADILKDRQLTVLNVAEIKSKTSGLFSSGISIKEKILFGTYLEMMIKSGLQLASGIDVLIADSKNIHFTQMLEEIKNSLEQGLSLSDALSKYPQVFEPTYLAVIKAGEAGGQLEQVLGILSQKLKRDLDLKNQIKSAMIYPAVILATLAMVGTLVMIFVFPKVISVFEKMNLKIPFTTKVLIWLSNLLTYNILLTAVGIIALMLTLIVTFKSPSGKKFLNTLGSRFPLTKKIYRSVDLSRLTSTLSILLKAGVPIEKSLQVASQVVMDKQLVMVLDQAVIQIKQGVAIGQSLKKNQNFIPEIMIKIIEVGEKTGTLVEVLTNLGDSYEEEVSDQLKNLTALIEPIMMLIVGILVGGVVLSIIGPIYQVVGKVGS